MNRKCPKCGKWMPENPYSAHKCPEPKPDSLLSLKDHPTSPTKEGKNED